MENLETAGNSPKELPGDVTHDASSPIDDSMHKAHETSTDGPVLEPLAPDWLVRARLGETPSVLDREQRDIVHFVRSALGGGDSRSPARKSARRRFT